MPIPYPLVNGPGSYPDAVKYMGNWQWILAMAKGNFLSGPGFEVWTAATSFTNPANGAGLSDGWSLEKGGTSGATANVARESTTIFTGAYSMKVDVTTAGSSDSYLRIKQSLSNHKRFAGLSMNIGVMVNTSAAGKVRVSIYDGVTTVYTDYHDGDGTWQKLSAAIVVASSVSELTVKVEITSDFEDEVFIDSSFLYVIESTMTEEVRETLEYFSPDDPFTIATLSVAVLSVTSGLTMGGNIAMAGFKVTGAGAASAAGDLVRYEQWTPLHSYRRPSLTYVSATTVDVENNMPTANMTRIIFPDGTYREVTEDTSSTNKYRRFIITAAAEFTSGTEDSGLRSGLSEATNTWYAIYAVKSAIDSTKFVLSGDTTLPTQANISTLNTRYGTSGWVYLGLIRNGDGSGATGDILSFVQSGAKTSFYNACTYTGSGNTGRGIVFASATNGGSSWTYAAGTSGATLPDMIKLVSFAAAKNNDSGGKLRLANQADTFDYLGSTGMATSMYEVHDLPAVTGGRCASSGGNDDTCLAVVAFVDSVLASQVGAM